MNFLGIDYGEKRIGLAGGDDELGVATPLGAATAATRDERLATIAEAVRQRRIDALVVGYPLHMDGSISAKAREVDGFIAELERCFGLPVHRCDERLTTREASRGLPGAKPKRLSPRQQKAERRSGSLDSRAAALILQDFLDARALARERQDGFGLSRGSMNGEPDSPPT